MNLNESSLSLRVGYMIQKSETLDFIFERADGDSRLALKIAMDENKKDIARILKDCFSLCSSNSKMPTFIHETSNTGSSFDPKDCSGKIDNLSIPDKSTKYGLRKSSNKKRKFSLDGENSNISKTLKVCNSPASTNPNMNELYEAIKEKNLCKVKLFTEKMQDVSNHANILHSIINGKSLSSQESSEGKTNFQNSMFFDKYRKNDSDGFTPLHQSISSKCVDITEFLLANGASPNVKTYSGVSALYLAAKAQSPETIQLLLTHGADPCIANTHDGGTALHVSVTKNDENSVNKLISGGANVLQCDFSGVSPVDIATRILSESSVQISNLN